MKLLPFILPIALTVAASLLTGCGTPEERARADALHRQAKLRKEAQERFADERKHEEERKKDLADRRRKDAEDIEDARRKAAEDARDHAEDMAKEHAEAAKKDAEYQAYLHEYARALGKTPSQLSPEERKRIHDKFY